MEEQKAVSEVEGKEVAEVSDEELAQLMAEGKKHQDAENSGDGVKADYILLAKSGTKALKKSQTDLYIEGLKIGDFFLQKEKKILGESLKVVPLAFITLYQEKESRDLNAKFFGVWNKAQAESYDLVEGSYFDRQLPNGHILQPVNWVCVEVLGHPELENAVIAYKSTGSRIWRKWKEDAKPRSQTSATLIYEIFEEEVSNDKNEWTDIGFKYAGSLLETDKAMAVKCLKKSNAIREAYENRTFVADHVVATVAPATKAVAQIEDASQTEESYDDDEMGF
jgi:hypothetical protein